MENSILPTQQTINITLSVLETKCLSFTFTEYGVRNKNPILLDGYEFVFTINFTVIEIGKQARVTIHAKLNEKKSDNVKLELAQLSATCLFFIENYDELITKDVLKNNFIIQNPAIQICSDITLSAMRGMFSIKLENSLYSNAVLPLFHPKTLIPAQKVS